MEEDHPTLRKRDKGITWQPYLLNDAKQDILEIYERLDVERKGYITRHQLHAALNEALGKPIRTETVRTLAARMDLTSRHGLKISFNDFLEYMAQKLLSAESYDDLLRSEQGPLMQEVGYKVYELLERFKRKQMLKDAMAGGDGIQRLLHLTTGPVANRNRRKGQSGADLMDSESSAKGTKAGGPTARGRAHRGGGGGGGWSSRTADSNSASHSIGDVSFASRNSALSRRASGTGAENAPSSSSPVQSSAATTSRAAANSNNNSGRPRRGRQTRNSAGPAARASSALASLLSRADGQNPDPLLAAAPGTEDRGSSRRWRKSTSHLLEEAQAMAAALSRLADSGSIIPVAAAAVATAATAAASTGVAAVCTPSTPAQQLGEGCDNAPGKAHTSNLSGQQGSLATSSPSLPLGSHPSSLQAVHSLPATGEASFSSQKRTPPPQQQALPASASAPAPVGTGAGMSTPFGRPSMLAQIMSVPGRSSGRALSSVLSPLGVASSVLPPASPLASCKAEGWRSAALMAQVLEVERIDLHSLVMEDLRATTGLPVNVTAQMRAQTRPLQSPPALHPPQQSAQLQGPPSYPPPHMHLQPQLLQQPHPHSPQQQRALPMASVAPRASSALQLRSQTSPRVCTETDEERRRSVGACMDADTSDAGEGASVEVAALGHHHQRAEGNSYASQPSISSPLATALQQRQPQRQQKYQVNSSPTAQAPDSPQQRHLHLSTQLQREAPPQPQAHAHPKLQQQHSYSERRREGDPTGTWLAADPEGALGLLLRGSLSSGGQPRNRSRFQSVSAQEALRLEVSGPIESDPVLARLPDWVRKGIGLPAAPVLRAVEPESGVQPVALAPPAPPLAGTSAAASGDPQPEVGIGAAAPRADSLNGLDSTDMRVDKLQGSSGNGGGVIGTLPQDAAAGSGHGSLRGILEPAGGGGHRPALSRGFSLSRQNTTRFVPFGGDTAAVVAEGEAGEEEEEEEEEVVGENAVAVDCGLSASMSVNSPIAAFTPEERRQHRQRQQQQHQHMHTSSTQVSCEGALLAEGHEASGIPESTRRVLTVPASFNGQVRQRLEGSVPSLHKPVTTWPVDPDVVTDGPGGSAEDEAELGWLAAGAEAASAAPKLLEAWEESVLAHRSSVGHGTLEGDGAHRGSAGAEEAGEGGEDDDDGVSALYEQLMGQPGSSRGESSSLPRRASFPAEPSGQATLAAVAPLVPHSRRQQQQQQQQGPQLHAQWQQEAQQDHHPPLLSQSNPRLRVQPQQPQQPSSCLKPQRGIGKGYEGDEQPAAFPVPTDATEKQRQQGRLGQEYGGVKSGHLVQGSSALPEPGGGGSSSSSSSGSKVQRPQSLSVTPAKLSPQPLLASMRPRSAAMLPSAAAVAAAAAAAAAARVSDDGSSAGRGRGLLWSADYVPCGKGGAASPPSVRLNHTAMLRLQAKYGSELVTAGVGALGLGGRAAAARDAAARELLQTLAATGSSRIFTSTGAAAAAAASPSAGGVWRLSAPPSPSIPLSSKDPSVLFSGAAATTTITATATTTVALWEPDPSLSPYAVPQRPRRCSTSSSSSNGGDGGGDGSGGSGSGVLPRRTSSSEASGFLPHDAVSLGHQVARKATQRASESGAVEEGPGRSSRPASAQLARPVLVIHTGVESSSAAASATAAISPASARILSPIRPSADSHNSHHNHHRHQHNHHGAVAAPAAAPAVVTAAISAPAAAVAEAGLATWPANGSVAAGAATRLHQAPPSALNAQWHPDPRVRSPAAVAAPVVTVAGPPRPLMGAAAAAGADNHRPMGRSRSVLAPTSHLQPTISIARVHQLDDSEISSCFTSLPVACNILSAAAAEGGDSGGGGGGPVLRNARSSPPHSPVPLPAAAELPQLGAPSAPIPAPASAASSLVSVPAVPALTTPSPSAPIPTVVVGERAGGSGGGGSSAGGSSMQGSSASSSVGSRGTMGTAEGTVAEARPRRQLEVMGTAALVPVTVPVTVTVKVACKNGGGTVAAAVTPLGGKALCLRSSVGFARAK